MIEMKLSPRDANNIGTEKGILLPEKRNLFNSKKDVQESQVDKFVGQKRKRPCFSLKEFIHYLWN